MLSNQESGRRASTNRICCVNIIPENELVTSNRHNEGRTTALACIKVFSDGKKIINILFQVLVYNQKTLPLRFG